MESSFIRSVKMNMIDSYYELVALGYPLIEREELEKYMLEQDALNEHQEMLAFIYSLQAICQQRFGYSDLAYENISKATQIMRHYYDDFSNYYIAATCSNVSYFFIGEGDSQKARFYNHFVDFYLKEAGPLMTEVQKNLYWIKLLVDYMANEHFPFLLPDEILHFVRQVIEEEIPPEWELAIRDFHNSNKDNIEERIQIYNIISKKSERRRVTSRAGDVIYDIVNASMAVGTGISLYSYVDSIHFRQKIFNLVVSMTNITENEYFSFSPPAVVTYLVVSVKVLLEMEKVVETGELITNGIDYYVLVAKNYRALNLLSKRYRIINRVYSDIVQQLEMVLQKHHQAVEKFHEDAPLIPVTHKTKMSRLVDFDKEVKQFMKSFVHADVFEHMKQNEVFKQAINQTETNTSPTFDVNSEEQSTLLQQDSILGDCETSFCDFEFLDYFEV